MDGYGHDKVTGSSGITAEELVAEEHKRECLCLQALAVIVLTTMKCMRMASLATQTLFKSGIPVHEMMSP